MMASVTNSSQDNQELDVVVDNSHPKLKYNQNNNNSGQQQQPEESQDIIIEKLFPKCRPQRKFTRENSRRDHNNHNHHHNHHYYHRSSSSSSSHNHNIRILTSGSSSSPYSSSSSSTASSVGSSNKKSSAVRSLSTSSDNSTPPHHNNLIKVSGGTSSSGGPTELEEGLLIPSSSDPQTLNSGVDNLNATPEGHVDLSSSASCFTSNTSLNNNSSINTPSGFNESSPCGALLIPHNNTCRLSLESSQVDISSKNSNYSGPADCNLYLFSFSPPVTSNRTPRLTMNNSRHSNHSSKHHSHHSHHHSHHRKPKTPVTSAADKHSSKGSCGKNNRRQVPPEKSITATPVVSFTTPAPVTPSPDAHVTPSDAHDNRDQLNHNSVDVTSIIRTNGPEAIKSSDRTSDRVLFVARDPAVVTAAADKQQSQVTQAEGVMRTGVADEPSADVHIPHPATFKNSRIRIKSNEQQEAGIRVRIDELLISPTEELTPHNNISRHPQPSYHTGSSLPVVNQDEEEVSCSTGVLKPSRAEIKDDENSQSGAGGDEENLVMMIPNVNHRSKSCRENSSHQASHGIQNHHSSRLNVQKNKINIRQAPPEDEDDLGHISSSPPHSESSPAASRLRNHESSSAAYHNHKRMMMMRGKHRNHKSHRSSHHEMTVRSEPVSSDDEDPTGLRGVKTRETMDTDISSDADEPTSPGLASGAPDDSSQVYAGLIGNIPIALYEGSPRRYGPKQQQQNNTSINAAADNQEQHHHQGAVSSSVSHARRMSPGYPQRIYPDSNSEIKTESSSILSKTAGDDEDPNLKTDDFGSNNYSQEMKSIINSRDATSSENRNDDILCNDGMDHVTCAHDSCSCHPNKNQNRNTDKKDDVMIEQQDTHSIRSSLQSGSDASNRVLKSQFEDHNEDGYAGEMLHESKIRSHFDSTSDNNGDNVEQHHYQQQPPNNHEYKNEGIASGAIHSSSSLSSTNFGNISLCHESSSAHERPVSSSNNCYIHHSSSSSSPPKVSTSSQGVVSASVITTEFPVDHPAGVTSVRNVPLFLPRVSHSRHPVLTTGTDGQKESSVEEVNRTRENCAESSQTASSSRILLTSELESDVACISPSPGEKKKNSILTSSGGGVGISSSSPTSLTSADHNNHVTYPRVLPKESFSSPPPADLTPQDERTGRVDVTTGVASAAGSDSGTATLHDPVVETHESELILLHERVHQHLLHELTSASTQPAACTIVSSGDTDPFVNSSHKMDGSIHSGSDRLMMIKNKSCGGIRPQMSKTSQVVSSVDSNSHNNHHQFNQLSEGMKGESRNFTLSPETTDCDSNEIESEYSLSSGSKTGMLNHMPVLEDGLSSGIPSSDSEYDADPDDDERDDDRDNCYENEPLTLALMRKQISDVEKELRSKLIPGKAERLKFPSCHESTSSSSHHHMMPSGHHQSMSTSATINGLSPVGAPDSLPSSRIKESRSVSSYLSLQNHQHPSQHQLQQQHNSSSIREENAIHPHPSRVPSSSSANISRNNPSSIQDNITSGGDHHHHLSSLFERGGSGELRRGDATSGGVGVNDSENARFDHQRSSYQSLRSSQRLMISDEVVATGSAQIASSSQPPPHHITGASAGVTASPAVGSTVSPAADCSIPTGGVSERDCDTDQETDRLLGAQRSSSAADDNNITSISSHKNSSSHHNSHHSSSGNLSKKQSKQQQVSSSSGHNNSQNASREVLIEGVLFRARYLGSTQLICEGQPTKATRMMQAEEAVSRIKAPEGETQPSTEVDLFISTEKIMVLNTDLKEIMMDHSLRTISYIADIGDLLVLMARRRLLTPAEEKEIKRIPKMICHVFESEEAQFIAQSIGQAFQVAYMEFLKANGIEDSSFVKEMDYQEVLNSQEIFGDELEMFAKKDRQKEVIVPKQKGEILGMVIVESGWGSMLPTVVIANMATASPAARCGHLNIGDQIIAINGVSLVGLPLSTCQNYVKNTRNQTAVKLTVVPCAPVVEVKIKRPDTKYQLGFSVQNGVICSLLRGGIAERGGVRVGHRIIEINGQSVVAVPHERIVNLLATSVGEITMKTMPTSMFRLLTGQESPVYM